MSSRSQISHTGRVVEVNPQTTVVEIISESACSSCHAAALCGVSEYSHKAIEVPTSPLTYYEVGEEVEVLLKATMGHKAVWLAYVAPLIVLIASMMLSLSLGSGELTAGLVGIGCIALYYLMIWLLRERLRTEYVFEIKKKNI